MFLSHLDKDSYLHDGHADKGHYRHDSRADKNPYRHDRRADSLSQHCAATNIAHSICEQALQHYATFVLHQKKCRRLF